MGMLTVKLFPVLAILFSAAAYFFPALFSGFGFLIVPFLGFIMLGMGATLSISDLKKTMKNPQYILLGTVLQFLLMPFLAYVIARGLHLPKEQLIGLVMVGAVSGGTASNVIAYLAGGDVALSITMTACSTVFGVFLTPLISELYLGRTVDVPMLKMFQDILLVVALPVSLGLVINRVFRKHLALLNKICPVVSSAGIILVIAIIMSLNVKSLNESGPLVILAVILHNVSGLAAGYIFAKLFRCDRKRAVTIAIEVGMQNSGLAVALSKEIFGISCALPGALFSIWHNISGAVAAGFAKPFIAKDESHAESPK